jgi:hypothetical protein
MVWFMNVAAWIGSPATESAERPGGIQFPPETLQTLQRSARPTPFTSSNAEVLRRKAEQDAFADAKTCHKPIPKGRAKPIDRFDIFSYGNRCPARFSFKEIVTELEHGRSISFKNISGLNRVFRKLKNKRWRCYN